MKRVLTGVVVSHKMDKTAVVRVAKSHYHPIYGKKVVRHKKYAAHDEQNLYSEGAVVEIRESRPFSKTKTWEVVGLATGGVS